MTDAGLVLVCGAAGGTQGSTGAHVVSLLVEQGIQVRALVHREDGRAVALRARGIPTVVADLHDPSDVERALDGVSSAYFAYPVRAGFVEAAQVFAEMAARIAIETVVSVSHLNAGPDALSPRTREHGLVELLFDEAGIGAIHLRAAIFFENIRRQVAASVRECDELQLPLGHADTKLPLIGGEDVARIVAGLLSDAVAYRGTPVLPIAEVMTAGDLAATFADVLGRPISYRPIADTDWRTVASTREGEDASVQVEHLSAVWATMQAVAQHAPSKFQPTPRLFETLGAQPARSLAAFIKANKSDFSPDDSKR